jgi:hypothetical protein
MKVVDSKLIELRGFMDNSLTIVGVAECAATKTKSHR